MPTLQSHITIAMAEQKLEKGWIDAIGETAFTIRSGGSQELRKTLPTIKFYH